MVIGICSEDPELFLVLAHILTGEGYRSQCVTKIRELINLEGPGPFTAAILDCRAENQFASEYSTLKRERLFSDIPTIALLKPGAEHQHVELLRAGVEACIVRPLVPQQFLAVLNATIAPLDASGAHASGSPIVYEDLVMHIDAFRVYRSGEEICLGPTCFNMLRYMLQNPSRVISRAELIRAAWPDNVNVGERTVDVHMSRLRKSLAHSHEADLIRTVRLGGYALRRIESP